MAYGLQDDDVAADDQGSGADELHKRVERQKLDAMLGLCEITSAVDMRCCIILAMLHKRIAVIAIPVCLRLKVGMAPRRRVRHCCIYRTGQRFGVVHVLDVLLGKRHRESQAVCAMIN